MDDPNICRSSPQGEDPVLADFSEVLDWYSQKLKTEGPGISGAEKVAQNIAATKSDTKAWTEKQRDHYYAEQRALEALRNGDRAPLDEALKTGAISREDAHHLVQRSKRTWLQEQKKELQPISRQKRDNLPRR
jgi:ribosomal protein L11 methylase PrmA